MDKCCNKCSVIKPAEEFPKRYSICKICTALYQKEYRHKNKDDISLKKKSYYEDNREKCINSSNKWSAVNIEKVRRTKLSQYYKNKERYLLKQADYRKNYPEKRKETVRKWAKLNSHKCTANTQKYKTIKLSRIPSWADLEKIAEIYHLAKIQKEITGVQWHVDHIVPLNSKIVSGLHWEINLRVISAKENISKSNKYWPDMWPKENN